MHSRWSLYVAIALTLAGMATISGCGVRGSLERPPHAKDATDSTTGKPAHKPSVLDPLIR